MLWLHKVAKSIIHYSFTDYHGFIRHFSGLFQLGRTTGRTHTMDFTFLVGHFSRGGAKKTDQKESAMLP